MKRALFFLARGASLLAFLAGVSSLQADINVRLSVKFILNFNGARPSSVAPDIGTNGTFQVEVDRGNGILAATGRGQRLQVVEYIDIQPPAPAGSNANYWYTLPARSNRSTIENAALANQALWRWNSGAINIYVNNTSSGQCSFVNGGSSISLGASISLGTVLHEVGHFFNLRHTHAGDDTGCTNVVVADGDFLSETIPDHNCLNRDGLSTANFGANYASLNAAQQAAVNTSWLNVMSYHQEDQLLDGQMDLWGEIANVSRLFVCSGRTWFVSNSGSDIWVGDAAGAPFATVPRALNAVGTPDDVILLRNGAYGAPTFINTRCTFRATRGPAFIFRQ